MASGPSAVLDGLFTASPPAVSLLTAPGVLVPSTGDGRWMAGVAFEPIGCGLELDMSQAPADNIPYWWDCPDGNGATAETTLTSKTVDTDPDNVEARAWTAWVGYTCRPTASPEVQAEYDARLLQKLRACLPAIIERELWTGQVATAAGFPNPFLADGEANVIDAAPGEALGELEQTLAECGCGGRHMIHAQPRVVYDWMGDYSNAIQVSPDGSHLRTVMGTIVVPGSGYPGTSDAGAGGTTVADATVFGTGQVRVWLGAETVQRVGYDTVDQDDNSMVLRAEIPVLVTYDPCCIQQVTNVP